VSDNCVLLTLERSLSSGRSCFVDRTFAATGITVWKVCRQTWDNQDWHTASSGCHWRHYYLDSETTAQCELFQLRHL